VSFAGNYRFIACARRAKVAQNSLEAFPREGNYMYFVLLYEVVDDFINRRTPFRPEHLKLVEEAHRRGELVMAGAFADPADGAALVFRANEPAVARHFAEADPYVANGLVTDWRVRGWNVVVGG
jgi:uncharacterized protein